VSYAIDGLSNHVTVLLHTNCAGVLVFASDSVLNAVASGSSTNQPRWCPDVIDDLVSDGLVE
jgi:hypothetical protein